MLTRPQSAGKSPTHYWRCSHHDLTSRTSHRDIAESRTSHRDIAAGRRTKGAARRAGDTDPAEATADAALYAVRVGGEAHKKLLLILARELANNLATPMFVVDVHGALVFYNEAAETLIGQSFSVTGPLRFDQWGGPMFQVEDLDGNAVTVNELPLARTLVERRPAHARFRFTALDGVKRTIEATSFPLFAHVDDLAGTLSVFWEEEE